MRKIITYLKENRQLIYRVLSFLISAIVIIYLYPREGHFPYEFQKGKAWLHADLYAPFDFPIRKTNAEIKVEKDSILQEYKPYFNYKQKTVDEQITNFTKTFGQQWNKFANEAGSNQLQGNIRHFFNQSDSLQKAKYKDFVINLIKGVYNKGIIQLTEQMEQSPSKDYTIVIIKDNIGSDNMLSEIYTPKTAYEYVLHDIGKLQYGTTEDRIIYQSGFFKELNLNQFLLPNLILNEEASKNVKDELVKKISLTKGMFRANDKVIGKDEMVNDQKFNLLISLKYEYENQLGGSFKLGHIILGQSITVSVLLILLIVYLVKFRREYYSNNLKFSFILMLVTIVVGFSSLIIRYDLINLYILPFALLPIIIKIFYDARLALFVHTVAIVMVGFAAPNSFEFIFLNFSTGAVAILSLTNTYRRGKLFNTSIYVILIYSVIYTGMFLMQGSEFSTIVWQNYYYFCFSGFLLNLSYPLIFIFEKTFGFLSDITLMELSDTNHVLLRKLNEKAPGTFQHSLQVANLAEEAAFRIGANPLLVRTGALYHDIGKMHNPIYFIENLSTEKNPHQNLTNEESARIIIEHVEKGIEIAKKNRIPEQIIDYIRTHHGTSTVQFFYRSSKKQNPEAVVDINKYTYPGPIPFSKEMALVMMADSVEAASRSLKDYNSNTINDLVDNIIYYQMINEQYNNSNITYKDQSIVKEIFKRKLMNIYHLRIEYPDDKIEETEV